MPATRMNLLKAMLVDRGRRLTRYAVMRAAVGRTRRLDTVQPLAIRAEADVAIAELHHD